MVIAILTNPNQNETNNYNGTMFEKKIDIEQNHFDKRLVSI